MKEFDFVLKPFSEAESISGIQIGGKVRRQLNIFSIYYEIRGDIARICLPELQNPVRRSDLWQTTCLEFFIGMKNSPGYWEFNLSSNGDWNIYKFTGYREGMEEEAIATLPFTVRKEPSSFQLDLSLDLAQIVEPNAELELGVTAVTESMLAEISYWALAHCGEQPDFHLRDSFQILM